MGTGSRCKQVETEAGVANDEFVDNTADLEPIDEEMAPLQRAAGHRRRRPHRSRCVSAEQETPRVREGDVCGH